MKPVLFVTGHVPAYRSGALRALHEHEQLEVALFGGSRRHGGAEAGELPFPHVRVAPRELFALATSGKHRAVICSSAGRLAPLATWSGARRARLPLILWASLWAHPRTPAHLATYLPLRRLYSHADAVVTYGPHVSAYVAARGARNVHVAPQSVDNDFWREAIPGERPPYARFLFVGRDAPEKGLGVLLAAWRRHAAGGGADTLGVVGARLGAQPPPRVRALGRLDPSALREVYAGSDVLVVPSIATRTFREPWGLVVNEAMNTCTAVIASDAVGATAGGLVRDGANGLVVPAGDVGALAAALARLASDATVRESMGRVGAQDVVAYNHDAWAKGFVAALSSLGVSRSRW